MVSATDVVSLAAEVVGRFDVLGVPCYIGGSVASSAHGIARSTRDIDLVARLCPDDVRSVVAAFEADCYVAAEAVAEAVAAGSCFNVIHYASAYKVDVFVAGADDPFCTWALARRVWLTLPGRDGPLRLPFASPEDTVAKKIAWYLAGGRTSERQHDDILGVLKAQRGRLDYEALRHGSHLLDVETECEAFLVKAGLMTPRLL